MGSKLTVTGIEQGLADSDDKILTKFTSDMNLVIDAFEGRPGDPADDTYYMFLIDKSNLTTKEGYMPFSQRYGFITVGGTVTKEKFLHTTAHELGHGAFNLRHPFSDRAKYPLPEATTDNLMDYGPDNGTELFAYQWDMVDDPRYVLTWFVSEQETAYSDKTYILRVLQRMRCASLNGDYDITFIKQGTFTAKTDDFGKLTIVINPEEPLDLQPKELLISEVKKTISDGLSGDGEYSLWQYKLDYGRVSVSTEVGYKNQDTEDIFNSIQNYLFPEDIIAEFNVILKDLEPLYLKDKLTNKDIEQVRAVANCGCQYLLPWQKVFFMHHIISDQTFLTEVDEDIILDLIENYQGDYATYAQEFMDELEKDKWLLGRMFHNIGNDLFQNENNRERMLTQLFLLWQGTTWSKSENYTYPDVWFSAAGSPPPAISPQNVGFDKSLFFSKYNYSVYFRDNDIKILKKSLIDGNTLLTYHPFQPVNLVGKTGDSDELSTTEPIPAIYYAGIIKKNNLQNNVTRLSLYPFGLLPLDLNIVTPDFCK